ncbi:uncharacterized protein [Dysidea avara]|uniref:uncharacterized protein n=1 Tax=Dysidea avara TaxID=196820 RepID=UPI003318B8DF
MCRTTQVFCGSLIVFLLSSYTTAMIPSWLSAVSFKCDGEDDNCAGALIDKQWIVTTASCFQNCNGDSPGRFKAFLNIPDRGNRRRASLKSGSKVSVEDVWMHPKYDSITFSDNIALVKLKCHDLTLNINAEFIKTNCFMSLDCSTHSHSGYLYSSKNRLRSRELSWELDSEGNVTLSRCSIRLGMDTIYYCANQPVAVSSNKMSECVKRRRIVPTTPICYHNEWIISVMQDNKAVCTPSTDAPLSTDKPTSTDESTDEPAPVTNGSMPTNAPTITTSSPSAVTIEPLRVVIVEPSAQPVLVVTTQPVPKPQTAAPDTGCMLMIDNGAATVTHYINDGATLVIEYTCNRGYHFSLNNNKLNRVCINGNMPSKPPPCKPITCRPFEPIANGRIEVTGLTYASVAHFICDPGYYITGSAIRSCDVNEEWNGIEGICIRKCTIPQSIVCNDGIQVHTTKSEFADIGDVVQYRVPSGYGLIGDPPICQPDSTWSAPPKCLKLCDERQNIPNAVVTIDRDIKSYTRKITCNQGYQPDGSDVQKCHFGTWTPIFRSCKRGCSDITLANGSTTMMLDNQFAVMECDKGFHLDPPLVLISCTEGMWQPSIPTCVPDQ